MQRYSPAWFIVKVEKRKSILMFLLRNAERNFSFFLNVTLLSGFIILYLSIDNLAQLPLYHRQAFQYAISVVTSFQRNIIYIFSAYLLFKIFPISTRAQIILTSMGIFVVNVPLLSDSLYLIALVHAAPLIAYILIFSSKQIATVIKIACTVAIALISNAYVSFNPELQINFPFSSALIRMILPFIMVFAEQGNSFLSIKQQLELLIPTLFITAVPMEKKILVRRKCRTVTARGILGLLFVDVVAIFFLISMYFPVTKYFFLNGFVIYIRVFLFSYMLGTAPVNFLRIFGYRFLFDDFRHPLLATSPMERWKGWNYYYYNFFLKVVFVPTAKVLKNGGIFVPLILCFFILFLINISTRMFSEYALYSIGSFFFLHFLAVYVFSRFRVRFNNTTRRSWIGVAVTLILMSFLHLWATNSDIYAF